MTPAPPGAARVQLGAALLSGAPQVLDLLQDGDLADERLRVVAGAIRGMVGSGIPVDATTVLARARCTGMVTRPAAMRGLAVLLAELIGECPNPASARWYAAAALEDALRRRTAEAGERLAQAAAEESLQSLMELVDGEHRAVRELADRRASVGQDRPWLRAVAT